MKLSRAERRRLQRETKPINWGVNLLQDALQAFYESMRDNRIGEERAEKILQETISRMGKE